jgi:hypothetical protein
MSAPSITDKRVHSLSRLVAVLECAEPELRRTLVEAALAIVGDVPQYTGAEGGAVSSIGIVAPSN